MIIPGSQVKAFREYHGFNQAAFAKKTGINQSALSRLERSESISVAYQMSIFNAFKQQWSDWVTASPFSLREKRDLIIPVVGEIRSERFDFSFETYPKDVLYFPLSPVAMRVKYGLPFAADGDYILICETMAPPAKSLCVVKAEDRWTLKELEESDRIGVKGIAVAILRRI